MVLTTRAIAVVPAGQRALSFHSFALISGVLALLAFAVDLDVYGPITKWAAVTLVEAPVERAWGFHAEWQEFGGVQLLTIISVAHGGAFERAGVRSGFAFAPRVCGFGGPLFGGPHCLLVGERTTRLRMVSKPGSSWDQAVFEITR